jgi:hypothetical protein
MVVLVVITGLILHVRILREIVILSISFPFHLSVNKKF